MIAYKDGRTVRLISRNARLVAKDDQSLCRGGPTRSLRSPAS